MALNNDERERLKNELAMIENDIQRVINREGPSDELEANAGDLPMVQNAQVHDYDGELDEIQQRSQNIINNLVRLYLSDNEQIMNHDYIRNKRQKDADYFAKLDFLVNASQRTLVNIMREIDMGAASPRMFEVLSMLQKEMRENVKLSSNNLTSIEKFYKDMRKDLGLQQEPENIPQPEVKKEEKKEEAGHIFNHADLNKQVDEWLKTRDVEKENREKEKHEKERQERISNLKNTGTDTPTTQAG